MQILYSVADDFGLHMLLGVSLSVTCIMFFWYIGKPKYRPLRFGGTTPISLGTASRWMLWYMMALVFEVLSSFIQGQALYWELAMSPLEAAGLAIGLFVADRARMVFEPEEFWMPRSHVVTEATSAAATPETSGLAQASRDAGVPAGEPAIPKPAPTPDVSHVGESWLAKHVRGAQKSLGRQSHGIVSQLRAAVAHSRKVAADTVSTAGQAASRPVQAVRSHIGEVQAAKAAIADKERERSERSRARSDDLLKDR